MTAPRPHARDEGSIRTGHARPAGITRIAVGVNGSAEARDAVYVATMIADATGGKLTLVAVVGAPPLPTPPTPDRPAMHDRAAQMLSELRDRMAPDARTLIETNDSVSQGLERMAWREQQDLLVVGSSRRALQGGVRIGNRTRRLPSEVECALAVAPRGLHAAGPRQILIVGVGYDGSPEAGEALSVAGSIARASGARLRVQAVADDRLPSVGWTPTGGPNPGGIWDEVVAPEIESLRQRAALAASATGVDFDLEIMPGSPGKELTALSRYVDLLVIGSPHQDSTPLRRLGGAGEHLMRHARCPIMVVPAAPSADEPSGRPAAPRT